MDKKTNRKTNRQTNINYKPPFQLQLPNIEHYGFTFEINKRNILYENKQQGTPVLIKYNFPFPACILVH